MSERRTLRTRVRVSEEELSRLHAISSSQQVSIGTLFRECTLAPSTDYLVETKISDLIEFSAIINDFDCLAADALSILPGYDPMLYEDTILIQNLVKAIDEKYEKLRELILQKRKKYRIIAVSCLSRKKYRKGMKYQSEEKNQKSISVSVSEDELKAIKAQAKEMDCSISDLLKRNVFDKLGNGIFTVNCDDLTGLNVWLRRQSRFLEAIVMDMKERYIEDGDVSNIIQILRLVLGKIIGEEETVSTDPKSIREDIKKRVRLERK